MESSPLALNLSIQAHKSIGFKESSLDHGLIGASEDSKITFLCKLPPSTSVPEVNS